MMFPESSFKLLPECISEKLRDKECSLRSPVDYYPLKFNIDKYETLMYNKRAIIPFLDEKQVKKVYESVQKDKFTKNQDLRNSRTETRVFYYTEGEHPLTTLEIKEGQEQSDTLLKKLMNVSTKKKDHQRFENYDRFSNLAVYGDWKLNEKGKI